MTESCQLARKRRIFHVMYVAVMRQVLVKLSNLLQCTVPNVNITTVNCVVCITG